MAALALVLVAAAAAHGLGLLSAVAGWGGYPADLASHFRLQYCLTALGCSAGFALLRSTRGTVAAIAVAVAVGASLASWIAVPDVSDATGRALENGGALRVWIHNVEGDNERVDDLARSLLTADADVLVVVELRRGLAARLGEGATAHGWQVARLEPRADNYGIGLLVRDGADPAVLLHEASSIQLGGLAEGGAAVAADRPGLVAELEWSGRRARLFAVHAVPPLSPRAAGQRDLQLATVARLAADGDLPAIIAGDFNATPWSRAFDMLRDRTGWPYAGLRAGVLGTYSAHTPLPLRIPIDHVVHGPELRTLRRELKPAVGSDHSALRFTLAWAAPRGEAAR